MHIGTADNMHYRLHNPVLCTDMFACSEKLGVVSRKQPAAVVRETVHAWLERTTINEELREPLQSLILHAQYARRGKTKAAAAVLAKAIKALDSLADTRKLESASNGAEHAAA